VQSHAVVVNALRVGPTTSDPRAARESSSNAAASDL